MKKVPPARCQFLLLFALLLVSCPWARGQNPCSNDGTRVSFAHEFQIAVDTTPYVITEAQILEKERRFRECIHYTSTPNLAPLKLKAIEFVKTLYCKADSIRRARNIPANQYITGVWMIIGMENNDICYSFQPTVLNVLPKGKRQKAYTFKTVDKGKVYCYKNDTFAIDHHLASKQQLYFNTVRIKHFDKSWANHKPGKFFNLFGNPRHRWRGDAREVFYSFQEILEFYSKKNPQEDRPGEYYSNHIYVNHSAANFRRWDIHFWRVKHNTFITVDSGTVANKKDFAITSIRDTGANLAHVCPSRCDNLRYPVLQRLQRQRDIPEAKK